MNINCKSLPETVEQTEPSWAPSNSTSALHYFDLTNSSSKKKTYLTWHGWTHPAEEDSDYHTTDSCQRTSKLTWKIADSLDRILLTISFMENGECTLSSWELNNNIYPSWDGIPNMHDCLSCTKHAWLPHMHQPLTQIHEWYCDEGFGFSSNWEKRKGFVISQFGVFEPESDNMWQYNTIEFGIKASWEKLRPWDRDTFARYIWYG